MLYLQQTDSRSLLNFQDILKLTVIHILMGQVRNLLEIITIFCKFITMLHTLSNSLLIFCVQLQVSLQIDKRNI